VASKPADGEDYLLDTARPPQGEIVPMITLHRFCARMRGVILDEHGQDMVEYALLAGFIAVASTALLPDIADSLSQVFSKVGSVTSAAAAK
jgi:Flp pilus assembly pilin Flp